MSNPYSKVSTTATITLQQAVKEAIEARDKWWLSYSRPRCWGSPECLFCDNPCAEKVYWAERKKEINP